MIPFLHNPFDVETLVLPLLYMELLITQKGSPTSQSLFAYIYIYIYKKGCCAQIAKLFG